MSDQYVGEIRMFAGNYAPQGWHLCDGTMLPISQNEVLFSLLGTTYGGNGQTTFALPDFRGRIPIGSGQGPGLQQRTLGQAGGVETIRLTVANMPPHSHAFMATSSDATSHAPANAQYAKVAQIGPFTGGYSTDGDISPVLLDETFLGSALGAGGGALPHDNMMPSQVTNYIIALEGNYPSQSY